MRRRKSTKDSNLGGRIIRIGLRGAVWHIRPRRICAWPMQCSRGGREMQKTKGEKMSQEECVFGIVRSVDSAPQHTHLLDDGLRLRTEKK